MTETELLIQEARTWARDTTTPYPFASLLFRLADALEALNGDHTDSEKELIDSLVTLTDNLHPVYRIAWDGEPSMSGQPHVQSVGKEFSSPQLAQVAIENVPGIQRHENVRIQVRMASEWEDMP